MKNDSITEKLYQVNITNPRANGWIEVGKYIGIHVGVNEEEVMEDIIKEVPDLEGRLMAVELKINGYEIILRKIVEERK